MPPYKTAEDLYLMFRKYNATHSYKLQLIDSLIKLNVAAYEPKSKSEYPQQTLDMLYEMLPELNDGYFSEEKDFLQRNVCKGIRLLSVKMAMVDKKPGDIVHPLRTMVRLADNLPYPSASEAVFIQSGFLMQGFLKSNMKIPQKAMSIVSCETLAQMDPAAKSQKGRSRMLDEFVALKNASTYRFSDMEIDAVEYMRANYQQAIANNPKNKMEDITHLTRISDSLNALKI